MPCAPAREAQTSEGKLHHHPGLSFWDAGYELRLAHEYPGVRIVQRVDDNGNGRGDSADMRIVDEELDLVHDLAAGEIEVDRRIGGEPAGFSYKSPPLAHVEDHVYGCV